MKKMNTQGFSLVEVLVVLAIIGALVAMILPNAFRAMNQSDSTRSTASDRAVEAAYAACRLDNNTDHTACDTAAELAPYVDGTIPNSCTITGVDQDGDGTDDSINVTGC
ncbi:MAG: prepilin-type N-terminal cleavage/methylation domain-containing protein [Candidatus Omnitrophota bacterium]